MVAEEFKKEIENFRTKHNLFSKFRLQEGYFIGPMSNTNYHNPHRLRTIILKYHYLDLYEERYGRMAHAVKFFMRINHKAFHRDDDHEFKKYAVILYVLMSFYEKRMNFHNIDTIHEDFSVINKFFMPSRVKSMYRDVFRYLTETKGLTPDTARNIIYGCDAGTEYGINNLLALMESLNRGFDTFSQVIAKEKFKRNFLRLADEYEQGRYNPIGNELGIFLEEKIWKDKEYIVNIMLEKTGARHGLLLTLDANPYNRESLKKISHLRVPDFIFMNDKMDCIALDSKLNFFTPKDNTQIGADNLRQIFNVLGMRDYLK